MDDRWLPLLIASLGVLGGVGGAFVGGWVANEGQEKQSESDRAAEVQRLRVETYGNFIGTAELTVTKFGVGLPQRETAEAFARLTPAGARVLLIAENPGKMRKAAVAVVKAITANVPQKQGEANLQAAEDRFLEAARDEIEGTSD